MKKIIFTIVVQAIVWSIILIPFLLPDSVTGYVTLPNTYKNPLWQTVATISAHIIILFSAIQTASWAERLYEYLRK